MSANVSCRVGGEGFNLPEMMHGANMGRDTTGKFPFPIPGFNIPGLHTNNTRSSPVGKPPSVDATLEISLEEAFTGKTKQVCISRSILNRSIRKIENETIYIDIPKGIDTNEIITVPDKGNIINNEIYGDVKVTIKIVNTTSFVRQGLDLLYKKNISLKESLCGFSFDLHYIDGRSFKIKNEKGNVISPGYKKIIPNMGIERENNKGDMIIIFTVIFPNELDESTSEKLKEIL